MRRIVAALIVTQTLAAQKLPRGEDPLELLERARQKILVSMRRLPKYTCLETIERTYYVIPPTKHGVRVMSEAPSNACVDPEHRPALSLDAKDRLRMEVATASVGEIHSWPGASQFDTRSIDHMISSGPMSSGSFGTYLVDLFANRGAQFQYAGKVSNGIRDLFEYSFRVPVTVSGSHVKAGSDWKATGYSGMFEINGATAELTHLAIDTDLLVPETLMCRAKLIADYHYTLIGDGEFLLPTRSELQTFGADGDETTSVMTYSECREYGAQSNIRFDDSEGGGLSGNADLQVPPLPAGVNLTLSLASPIFLNTAAAGDPVSARVTKEVRSPIIPAGAIARGRILQMRRQFRQSSFLVSIRFDTLEVNGKVVPLEVRLARDLNVEKRQATKTLQRRPAEFTLPPAEFGEHGAVFMFPAFGESRVIRAGFESKWITVAK